MCFPSQVEVNVNDFLIFVPVTAWHRLKRKENVHWKINLLVNRKFQFSVLEKQKCALIRRPSKWAKTTDFLHYFLHFVHNSHYSRLSRNWNYPLCLKWLGTLVALQGNTVNHYQSTQEKKNFPSLPLHTITHLRVRAKGLWFTVTYISFLWYLHTEDLKICCFLKTSIFIKKCLQT